jgi:hypothetical protein
MALVSFLFFLQPRADDQIKIHFDQSNWGDPTIYTKYLGLPPGTF